MAKRNENNIQLGFAEEQEEWLLTNGFFPSKIGFKPAWLELENIPHVKELTCDYCDEVCIFLCQVYASSEVQPHAFHRTIYVFICKNGKCCSLNQTGNIKIFRSQLSLKNNFYPDTPADETVVARSIESIVRLCDVCGCRGPLMCGNCKQTNYCGQSHQKLDWKIHKLHCKKEAPLNQTPSEILFPEFEILIEKEELECSKQKETEKEAEQRRLLEYENLVKSGQAGTMMETSDLNEQFEEAKEDKTFVKFKKAIDPYELQVLRYNRHGSVLWISDHAIPNEMNVPNCPICLGKRTFEFQIMPQMLNELKNYDLDWGVIAIYTCEKDCDVKGQYALEFCYKQDIAQDDDNNEKDLGIDKLNIKTTKNEKQRKTSNQSVVVNDVQPEIITSSKVLPKMKKSSGNTKKSEASSEAAKKMFEEKDEW